jgi:amidase
MAALCESLGCIVDETALPVNGPRVLQSFQTVWGHLAREAAGACALEHGAEAAREMLEPWTRDLAAWSDALSILDAESLVVETVRASETLDLFFDKYDFILSPVLRRPALKIGELAPTRPFDDIMSLMYDYVSYTPLHNLTGHPAISLPVCPGADGVPIGSMFAAARGGEEALLSLAAQIEIAAGWKDRWPPVSVAREAGG